MNFIAYGYPSPWAGPFSPVILFDDWTGWLFAGLAAAGAISLLWAGTNAAVSLLMRIPAIRRPGAVTAPAPADGRNVLRAVVRGTGIPELEYAALDRARDLYGPDANLTVQAVENVATSTVGPAQFVATVYVRRLPGLPPVPADLKPSAQEASTS